VGQTHNIISAPVASLECTSRRKGLSCSQHSQQVAWAA
jgi:hypothetical protein